MKILISGGGIAGFTAAYWLRHDGHQPIVIEKAPSLRSEGYIIDFVGTGWDVAEKMSLIPQLRRQGESFPYLVYKDGQNKTKATLQLKKLYRALGVVDEFLALNRADLVQQLYESIQDQVDVRFGTTIQQIQPTPTGVTVIFNDDSQEAFDLVVGADGIHSRVRQLVFGDESQFAHFLGYYVATFYAPNNDYDIQDGFEMHLEPGRQTGLYRISDERLLAYFVYKADDQGPIPHDERKQNLITHYDHVGWYVPEILNSLTDTTPIFLDSVTQIRMPRWHKGRVVLIGDAAYCATLVSGQGASLAMGGAYVLAEELNRVSNYETAFANYEKRLRPHIEETQESARKFAPSFVPSTWLGIHLTHLVIKLTVCPLVTRFVAKQFNVDSILT